MANLYTVHTRRKSEAERDPRSLHLEEWCRVSVDRRKAVLGENWFEDSEKFYSIIDNQTPSPSFRPVVRVPQLQTLMLHEANDLSESSPRVYIVGKDREEQREKAFQAQWRQSQMNFHLLLSGLDSLYNGTSFFQVGFDPLARNGRGRIWGKYRPAKTVFPDPTADYEFDTQSYIIYEDWLSLDYVRAKWPLTSRGVKPRVGGKSISPTIQASDAVFQMPPGPMSMVPGMANQVATPTDNRVRVRTCFCVDYTLERVEDKKIPPGAIADPDFNWKYPNGRMLVECEGQILRDGDNPFPMKMWNIVPIWALPPLYGIWGIPAIRLSQDLQMVGQKMLTQLYENAVRMNNATWFVEESTGIDVQAFGGLPGEIQVINANSKPPTPVWGGNIPQGAYAFPDQLFSKQKEIQGFTPARQGNPGAGNISTDLFDESVLRSQGMTQLRGRLLAYSIQRISELIFYTMARYMTNPKTFIPFKGEEGFEMATWEYLQRPDQHDLYLDEASIRPLSQAMIRRMAPELMKSGVLSTRRGLESIDFPHAEEISEEQQNQQKLAALAKIKGRK